MLQYPRALKRFTLKGEAPIPDFGGPLEGRGLGQCINVLKIHSSSIETLNLDLYTEGAEPIDLSGFTALKRLTISPRMLLGDDPKGWPGTAPVPHGKDFLPSSLEHLTLRADEAEFPLLGIYEKVRIGALPRLRHFTCEMLSGPPGGCIYRCSGSVLAEECTDEMSFALAFEKLGVQFSVVEVDDPTEVPEHKTSPCQCWTYQHAITT